MSGASLSCRKWSLIGFSLAALIVLNAPLCAQEAAQSGVADDWSHHHAVFSTPSREQDALKSGHYNEWFRIVTEPRYVTQQRKRNSTIVQPTPVAPLHRLPIENGERVGGFADPFSRRPPSRTPKPSIHKDWSMNDGATHPLRQTRFPQSTRSPPPRRAATISSSTPPDQPPLAQPPSLTATSTRAHAPVPCPPLPGPTTQAAHQRSLRCFHPTGLRSLTSRPMRTSHRWCS